MSTFKRAVRKIPGFLYLYHWYLFRRLPPGHKQYCNTIRGGDCDCYARYDLSP